MTLELSQVALGNVDEFLSQLKKRYHWLKSCHLHKDKRERERERERERVEDNWVCIYSGAKVRICGETSSAFPLWSLISSDWYRATLRHRIILVSPRFFTLTSLVQSHLKESNHYYPPSLLYFRDIRTESSQGNRSS